MNGFNEFIGKRNFKKIFIIYVIAAVICGIACTAAVGYIFKDKISLAYRYEKAAESMKKESYGEKVKQNIEKLAASSNDICDVLVLDDRNSVVYSAKDSDFAKNRVFELKKSDGSRLLQSDKNSSAVFRFVKKDEFMLSSVLADGFKEIYDEYDEDSFYLDNVQNKNLYMISLLGRGADNTKAYVISKPSPVQYGMLSLKAAASILMFLFMIYWIIIALWVYQNAQRSKLSAPVWGIIVLFTNLAGVLVYLIYKHVNGVCVFCGAVQPRENTFCTACGNKIGKVCAKCGHSIKMTDNYCPKCGSKTE